MNITNFKAAEEENWRQQYYEIQKENADLKVEKRVLELKLKKLEEKVELFESNNSDVVIQKYTDME